METAVEAVAAVDLAHPMKTAFIKREVAPACFSCWAIYSFVSKLQVVVFNMDAGAFSLNDDDFRKEVTAFKKNMDAFLLHNGQIKLHRMDRGSVDQFNEEVLNDKFNSFYASKSKKGHIFSSRSKQRSVF
ncbi:hypothetical protein [Bacillus sp. 03113]|uniref:hypothetical protein n=1 Tax=Bacillus sp. 03113 TaxID=2578211 RepID=UPI0015E87B39|nr:hypothetical protein [Bacillus sp. 03113]